MSLINFPVVSMFSLPKNINFCCKNNVKSLKKVLTFIYLFFYLFILFVRLLPCWYSKRIGTCVIYIRNIPHFRFFIKKLNFYLNYPLWILIDKLKSLSSNRLLTNQVFLDALLIHNITFHKTKIDVRRYFIMKKLC